MYYAAARQPKSEAWKVYKIRGIFGCGMWDWKEGKHGGVVHDQ